jgi:signal transduction histidine kinase
MAQNATGARATLGPGEAGKAEVPQGFTCALRKCPMAITKEWRWLLVSLVLLGLLGWLATEQYRGIASISDAERARLQAGAQARGLDMARAFDAEISRAYLAFYQMTLQAQGEPDIVAARQYARWLATAKYPRLIRGVFLLTSGEQGTQLRRVVPNGPAEPADWPSDFGEWIPKLKANASLQRPGIRGFLLSDVPAFYMPLANVSISASASNKPMASGSFSFKGLLFGWLDRQYLEREFLPKMVARFFATGEGVEYKVAVVSPREKNRLVYVSERGLPLSAFASPDVHTTLFQVRLEELLQAVAGSSGASLSLRSDTESGEWQLRVVHRAGSIDRAVVPFRRRNLAASFGAVLLVAASAGFLLISTRRAQRLARQQVVFVAGVSHELRTPLAVIRSAGENLSDGVIAEPAQVQRYGTLIADEGRRLSEMVEQVMAFAGFESGRDLSERTVVSVAQLIEDAAAVSRIEEAGCTLERSVPADLPMVRANASALAQAIENLLSNAAKYGGADRWARIAAEVSPDGRDLRISVADHGRGVRPDEQRRIFEPFFRSADVVGTTIRGSGLGLSLAKRIVEAHGGSISVRSARGQGSAFTLHVPIDASAAEAARPVGQGQPAPIHPDGDPAASH